MAIEKTERVNIKALAPKKGKNSRLIEGKVYAVGQETADQLIKNKKAVKAAANEEVGKVYKSGKITD